jgi:hypothetical protein
VAATTFSDTGRTANTTYWYRVTASNGRGDGPPSDPASVMTAPNAPGAPTFSSIGPTTLTLVWTAPSGGAATYKVERSGSAVGPWTQLAAGVTGLEYVDGSVTASTTWYYRVRATNADLRDGAYSLTRWVTTPAPPGS